LETIPQLLEHTWEHAYPGREAARDIGSMLIVAWVMSDPVNCELMGRLVMHRLSLSQK
jgi:hypothetical protein